MLKLNIHAYLLMVSFLVEEVAKAKRRFSNYNCCGGYKLMKVTEESRMSTNENN